MNSLTFQTLPSNARVLTVDETDRVAGGPLPLAVIAGAKFAGKAFATGFFGGLGGVAAISLYNRAFRR